MAVFVLDKQKRPLMPCTPKRARKLLASGRARVHLLFPFCIRLVDRTVAQSTLQPLALKIDPGSVTSGIAVCRIEDAADIEGVVEPVMHIRFLLELAHRGKAIQAALHARASMRRRRRSKNLRYRAPRFNNRIKPAGWPAPSLRHRIDTVMTQVARLCRLAPITRLAQELVRFDMQLMQNAEIAGALYQQGTLAGYEVREYLLEKFKRACAYCDATGVPLQMEHIHPKAPLRDASAVNATRWALHAALKNTGLPVATGTGGQTKWNRSRLGVIKTHALDAACVGVVHDLRGAHIPTLRVTCTGRGSRCKPRLNKYGFPRGYLTRKKTAFGFRTGDMVEAKVPSGKNRGLHRGRVAIRMTGNFNIQPGIEGVATVQGISHKHCRIVQRADGYGYIWQKTQLQTAKATSMTPSPTAKPKAATSAMSAPAGMDSHRARTAVQFVTGLKADVSRSKI